MINDEYKDVEIGNNAIVNTEPQELPEEPHWIPQGKKPQLNPNPGYGEDGKTKPALVTELEDGGRGTPIDIVTPEQEGVEVIRKPVNFVGGLKVKGKELEDYIDSKGGVTEEEMETFVAGAIQADKDVISKIKMKYSEDDNLTIIKFPNGVMPLSIELNNNDLYFKEFILVNQNGEQVEGYELDDYYNEQNHFEMTIIGDISEQIINNLVYLPFSGRAYACIVNTYALFYPITESGTKLYEHKLTLSSGSSPIEITVITNSQSEFVSAGGPPKPSSNGIILGVFYGMVQGLADCSSDRKGLYSVFYIDSTNAIHKINAVGMSVVGQTTTEL